MVQLRSKVVVKGVGAGVSSTREDSLGTDDGATASKSGIAEGTLDGVLVHVAGSHAPHSSGCSTTAILLQASLSVG
jgi:hypothetical protein